VARVSPIEPLTKPRTVGWLSVRSTSTDGSCGVHGYPCQHPGVDVLGPAGTLVQAPEGGAVVTTATGASPPYVGYGPFLVVIHGDSGKYHLLAHLDPSANVVDVGERVEAGDVVGQTSSANHTHWEVRTLPVPPAGMTNIENNGDPEAWLSEDSSMLTLLLGAAAAFGIYYLFFRKRPR